MKYLVIGAGGAGGCIGGYLAHGGKDVTLIARGAHLAAIRQNGLTIRSEQKGAFNVKVEAVTMEDYKDAPDVVFVCVKGYSLPETILFLKRVCEKSCVVIPVLNVYGTGGRLARELPGLLIPDGCVYVSSYISGPGDVTQKEGVFRVVYGMRDHSHPAVLDEIAHDLEESGVGAFVSDCIQRDALQKFSIVSPMAAAGSYYDVPVGGYQKPGKEQETFLKLVGEVGALAEGMGIPFEMDIVKETYELLMTLNPEATASMQKDLKKGGPTEMDGLIFEPVRLGKQYGVETPAYAMIAKHFGFEL